MANYITTVAVWPRPDGGVSITYFSQNDTLPGESESELIARIVERNRHNFNVDPVFMDISEIPADKTNRNFFTFKNGKVEIDITKKNQQAVRKSQILQKLNVTEDELRQVLRG